MPKIACDNTNRIPPTPPKDEEMFRFISLLFAFTILLSAALGVTSSSVAQAGKRDGVVTLESRYSVSETVKRIKADVAEKGIMLFDDIDQAELGNAAGNKVRPSRLILFGNPALGTTFITANPISGLDWPVRVLIYEAQDGSVNVAYNDFDWVAQRHGIRNRKKEFHMATEVIESVVSSVRK